MYKIISLFLFITGLSLFFAPDYVSNFVGKGTDTMKMINEYNKILGFGVIVLGYYVYNLEESNDLYTVDNLTSINKTESVFDRLPSSEKITELS